MVFEKQATSTLHFHNPRKSNHHPALRPPQHTTFLHPSNSAQDYQQPSNFHHGEPWAQELQRLLRLWQLHLRKAQRHHQVRRRELWMRQEQQVRRRQLRMRQEQVRRRQLRVRQVNPIIEKPLVDTTFSLRLMNLRTTQSSSSTETT